MYKIFFFFYFTLNQQASWSIRNCLFCGELAVILEYERFFILRLDQQSFQNMGNLFFEKYKKFFVFPGLRIESSIPQNIRNLCFLGFASSIWSKSKFIFGKNVRVFKLGLRKFHFPKYKKFFQSGFLLFFKLGLKSVPGTPLIPNHVTTCLKGCVNLWVEAPLSRSPACHVQWALV